ncbi:MAG: hypothetical protein WBX22_20020 [Silvibacterium sp.]
MGKASKAKKNRTSASYSRLSLWSHLPDGSTALFAIDIVVLGYGTTAMQYSRWNHAENAHVHPVFHPWAIVLGLVLLGASLRKKSKV